MLDAERLRRGLRELERRDPSRAAAVKLRALAAVAIMQDYFPGDPSQGILRDDEEAEDRFCERFGSFPCPVLDPVSGRCDLYANRPISCRTFGPPVVVGGQSLPPCHLCFVGAPPSEIARCRVEPDPACTEDDLLQRIEQKGRLKGATTAAFALAIHL
jgi:Fe-S-cluster containining protein